jgi:hypothetical protein
MKVGAESGVHSRLVHDGTPHERLSVWGQPRALAGFNRRHGLGLQYVDLLGKDSRLDHSAHDAIGHRGGELGGDEGLGAIECCPDDHHVPCTLDLLKE